MVVVRSFGRALQKAPTLEMANSHAQVDVTVQFLTDMCPRFPGCIAHDHPSGGVVKRVVELASQRSWYCPVTVERCLGSTVSPTAEQVGYAEAVVCRRIYGGERAVHSALRIPVAGRIVARDAENPGKKLQRHGNSRLVLMLCRRKRAGKVERCMGVSRYTDARVRRVRKPRSWSSHRRDHGLTG